MKRRIATALFLCALVAPSCLGEDTVRRWARFEATVTNSTPYANPYRDVTLLVAYTKPDGSTVRFPGFFDGEQTWRFRFMPDQLGTWQYEASFSDGAPGTIGTFTCIESDVPGPLVKYGPNPIWFGTADGSPYLMRSLHCGDRFFATNWDDPMDAGDGQKRTEFLDWVQRQGYNTLSIASHYLNRSIPGRGGHWHTPRLWPLQADEFRKLEAVLDDLAERRIVVFPFAGLFGRNSNFPGNRDEQDLYLRYTIARLGPYWNVLWNVAGPEPLLRNKPYMTYAEIDRIARRIGQLDVLDHLMSVHNATGDDVYRAEDWHDFGTLQGPKTRDRAVLARGLNRNHHPARPLYAQETLWPGNQFHPKYTDEDIRKNALVMLFSAAMINFGDMDGNSSSGFTESLDPARAVATRHHIMQQVWDTFATLPWAGTRPRPDLSRGGYCLADPGQTYLIYLADTSQSRVHVEPGPYAVQWISARHPQQPIDAGRLTGNKELHAPGDGDWILVLRSVRKPILEANGRVAFEAEAGRGEWNTIQTPTGKGILDPGGGRMHYRIRFNQPGAYYVFLLAKQGPRGKDKENDVLMSLNGERLYGDDHQTRPDGMRSYGDWKWAYLPKGPGSHTPDAIRNRPVYFQVPEPGIYTFEIAHRSANFAIDKIVMKLNDPKPPPD